MSTVDEILAEGLYESRNARVWVNAYDSAWFSADPFTEITTGQMRLLIERDQHRDECVGLNVCWDHPVPSVITSCESGSGRLEVYAAQASVPAKFRDTLPEAMDAARELAVGT